MTLRLRQERERVSKLQQQEPRVIDIEQSLTVLHPLVVTKTNLFGKGTLFLHCIGILEIGFDVLDSTTTMMILRSRQERERLTELQQQELRVVDIEQSLRVLRHLLVSMSNFLIIYTIIESVCCFCIGFRNNDDAIEIERRTRETCVMKNTFQPPFWKKLKKL